MDIEEIRARDTDELHTLLENSRADYTDLKFKRVTDVIEDSSAFKRIRKDIARILTVINEREQASAGEGGPAEESEEIEVSSD